MVPPPLWGQFMHQKGTISNFAKATLKGRKETDSFTDQKGWINSRWGETWPSRTIRFLVWMKLSPRPWQESRSREILEEKWLTVFPLKLEKWIFISRSPLEFQDFENKNSLSPLLSQDLLLKFSFSSRFWRFWRQISLSPLNLWNIDIESLFLFSIFKIIFFFSPINILKV